MKTEQMGDPIAKRESKFARLASKNNTVSESMQVAILDLSLSDMHSLP